MGDIFYLLKTNRKMYSTVSAITMELSPNWRQCLVFSSPGELEKDKTHLMEFVPGFRSYLLGWVSGLSIPIISPHPLNQKVTIPLDTSHPHNANLSKYFYTYSRHWEPGG